MQKTIQNAIEKYQGGDLKGAIALLEPLRGAGDAHPAALSLLGSLYLERGPSQGRPRPPGADRRRGSRRTADPRQRRPARPSPSGRPRRPRPTSGARVAKAPDSPAARDLGLVLGSDGQDRRELRAAPPLGPRPRRRRRRPALRGLRRHRARAGAGGRGAPRRAAGGQPADPAPARAPPAAQGRPPGRHRPPRAARPERAAGAAARGAAEPRQDLPRSRRLEEGGRAAPGEDRRRTCRSPFSSAAPSTRPAIPRRPPGAGAVREGRPRRRGPHRARRPRGHGQRRARVWAGAAGAVEMGRGDPGARTLDAARARRATRPGSSSDAPSSPPARSDAAAKSMAKVRELQAAKKKAGS